MIHSLPLDRRELYITNYVSGFVFLFVPELIAFIAGVLVCLANQITCIQYLFYWFLYMAGVSLYFAAASAVYSTGLLLHHQHRPRQLYGLGRYV